MQAHGTHLFGTRSIKIEWNEKKNIKIKMEKYMCVYENVWYCRAGFQPGSSSSAAGAYMRNFTNCDVNF